MAIHKTRTISTRYCLLNSVLLAALGLLLTGCVSMRVPKAPVYQATKSSARAAALEKQTVWIVVGAVSIQVNKKTEFANVSWQQHGRSFSMDISGPLRLGARRLVGQPGQVTLYGQEGGALTGRSAEALLQKSMGWQLPVTNLYYWARGLPAPGLPAAPLYDQFGHLHYLAQEGWQIQYLRYQHVGTLDLPSLMQLVRPNVKIRLAIRRWQLGGIA